MSSHVHAYIRGSAGLEARPIAHLGAYGQRVRARARRSDTLERHDGWAGPPRLTTGTWAHAICIPAAVRLWRQEAHRRLEDHTHTHTTRLLRHPQPLQLRTSHSATTHLHLQAHTLPADGAMPTIVVDDTGASSSSYGGDEVSSEEISAVRNPNLLLKCTTWHPSHGRASSPTGLSCCLS